ncbi:hypothetical protein [Paenibacillus kobensis]|uniref:hypothetical protein n=1 Tax=Paenibacillus kobensis TaxID=59841 RepID=UPI000FDC601E|nr:hypothetical protein [Paenibacillus kobensis]
MISPLKFVTSLSAKPTANPLLPVREEVPYQYEGKSLEQFYTMKDPDPEEEYEVMKKHDLGLYLYSIFNQEFAVMKSEGRSLEETMEASNRKAARL